jgi:MFS family permease
LTGTSVTFVAFPVLVYSLSGSPLLTSLVAALEAVPYLMFGLPAGALADRLNRKRVMVAVDAVNAVVLASIPIVETVVPLAAAALFAAAVRGAATGLAVVAVGAGGRCTGRSGVSLVTRHPALHDRGGHGPVDLGRGVRGSDGRLGRP